MASSAALQERYDREVQRQARSVTTETDGPAGTNGVSDVAGRGEEPVAEGANDGQEQVIFRVWRVRLFVRLYTVYV